MTTTYLDEPTGNTYFRLSTDQAERFESLVSPINTPHRFGDEDLTVLVHLKARVVPVEYKRKGPGGPYLPDHPPRIFEIVSARLIAAEFITAGWRSAWGEVDEIVREIRAETSKGLTDEDRPRIQALIDRGGMAVNRMADYEPREDWIEQVHTIDPEARVSSPEQRQRFFGYGRSLADLARELGIEPETPLPKQFRTEVRAYRLPAAEVSRPLRQEPPVTVDSATPGVSTHKPYQSPGGGN
jgi:hypothetical protein